MCSYPSHNSLNITFDEPVSNTDIAISIYLKTVLKALKARLQPNTLTASALFMSREPIYKRWDYRSVLGLSVLLLNIGNSSGFNCVSYLDHGSYVVNSKWSLIQQDLSDSSRTEITNPNSHEGVDTIMYFVCRCLDPNSNKSPNKWKTYDMAAFRAASDNQLLKSVKTSKYNKNFNNWINPEVLKRFSRKSTYLKTWRKSYNFKDHVSLDKSELVRQCKTTPVSSRYAKSCKEKQGTPSCCISTWKLKPFEKARNDLIKEGLIKTKTTRYCKARGRKKKDPCVFYRLEKRCLLQDSNSKENILKKPKYHLQGHGDDDTCKKAKMRPKKKKSKKRSKIKKSKKRSKNKKAKKRPKKKKPKKKRSKNRSRKTSSE